MEDEPIQVLHVEDDPDFAALATRLLEREGDRIEVRTAGDAAAAMDALRERRVDCVLSDFDMPGRNGIELLRDVRAEHPDLPFILFTGRGSEEVASDAISAGVTDYIRKRPGREQFAILANRVETVVEGYRSRRALERRTRRLETLVSNLPGIVYRCRNEPPWPMEFVDGECERLTGYDAAALESGEVSWGEDLLHPADRDALWTAVQDAVEGGDPFEVTYRIRTREGETRWLWERGRAVDDDLIEGFITDVTERVAREQTLERYRAMVDAMQEAACIYDTEGRFEVVNEHLSRFFDASPEDLRGEPSTLVENLRESADGDPYRELLDGERAEIRGEVERSFPGSGEVVLDYRITRLTIDGDVVGAVGVARDVTDRVERERELRRQNERLDEFTGIVSHDLRTPLTVAEGRLSLAREECDSAHLEHVASAHDALRTLIDALLAVARAGEGAIDPEPVPLADAARDAWADVSAPDAALVVEDDAVVRADPDRLGQLLENLLSNAVDHGGRDDLTVRVGAAEERFYVADDGCGVPPGDREQVFEEGYTTAADGTGYGLTVVRRVADLHDWTVDLLESAAGGARFEVRDATVER